MQSHLPWADPSKGSGGQKDRGRGDAYEERKKDFG
jgi:hypothetical protein